MEESLAKIGNWLEESWKQNHTKILTRISYAGIFTGPVLGFFAGVRTKTEIEKRKKERNVEMLPLDEMVKIGAKESVGTAVATVATYVSARKVNSDLTKTIDALTTMAVVRENAIHEIKEAEKEVVGEKKAEEIQEKADKKALSKADTKDIQLNPAAGIYACLEPKTGQIFPTTEHMLNESVKMLNKEVMNGSSVSLSEFIQNCGGDWCDFGDIYEFPPCKDGYDIFHHVEEDRYGRPAYVILYGFGATPVLKQ